MGGSIAANQLSESIEPLSEVIARMGVWQRIHRSARDGICGNWKTLRFRRFAPVLWANGFGRSRFGAKQSACVERAFCGYPCRLVKWGFKGVVHV